MQKTQTVTPRSWLCVVRVDDLERHLRVEVSFRAPRGATPFLLSGHTFHPSYRGCLLDGILVFFRDFAFTIVQAASLPGAHNSARRGSARRPHAATVIPLLASVRSRGPLELGRVRCFAYCPPETCCRALGVLEKPWENRLR